LSLCTIAHPFYPRIANIFGASISETTMRPNPTLEAAARRASELPGLAAGGHGRAPRSARARPRRGRPPAGWTRAPHPARPPGRSSPPRNLKFTGLAQNSQVGPALCLEIPIRHLKPAQILGQPCEFYLRGAPGPTAGAPPGGAAFAPRAMGGRVILTPPCIF
jgi:hypothetical protein